MATETKIIHKWKSTGLAKDESRTECGIIFGNGMEQIPAHWKTPSHRWKAVTCGACLLHNPLMDTDVNVRILFANGRQQESPMPRAYAAKIRFAYRGQLKVPVRLIDVLISERCFIFEEIVDVNQGNPEFLR